MGFLTSASTGAETWAPAQVMPFQRPLRFDHLAIGLDAAFWNRAMSPKGRATSMAPSRVATTKRAVSLVDPVKRSVRSFRPCSKTLESQIPLSSKNRITMARMGSGMVWNSAASQG